MNLSRLEGIVGTVSALTVIIPFLLRIFVKPIITAETEKLRKMFDDIMNQHMKDYHYRPTVRRNDDRRP